MKPIRAESTESRRTWSDGIIPQGWGDVVARTLLVTAIAFVTFNVKEWSETRQLDPAGTGLDTLWIGAATLLVNAILRMMR